MVPTRSCSRCADSGKAPRTKTIDTELWECCDCAAGSALRNGISMEPIPPEDLQRARQFLRDEGIIPRD